MGHYQPGCEVCIANKYNLWGRKRGSSKLPKIASAVLKKILLEIWG
jgi:hypothetical protein